MYTRPSKLVPKNPKLLAELYLVPSAGGDEAQSAAAGSGSLGPAFPGPGSTGVVGRTHDQPRVVNPIWNHVCHFRLGPNTNLKIVIVHEKFGQVVLAQVVLDPTAITLPFHGFVDMVPARGGNDGGGPPVLEFTLKLHSTDDAIVVTGIPGPMPEQAFRASAPDESPSSGAAAPEQAQASGSTMQGSGSAAVAADPPKALAAWDTKNSVPAVTMANLVNTFTIAAQLWAWKPSQIAEWMKSGQCPFVPFPPAQGPGEVQGSGYPASKYAGITYLALGFQRDTMTYHKESQLYTPDKTIFSPMQMKTCKGVKLGLELIMEHPEVHSKELKDVLTGLTAAHEWVSHILEFRLVWGPMVAHALLAGRPFHTTPEGDYLPVPKLPVDAGSGGSDGSGSAGSGSPCYWDYLGHIDIQLDHLKAALLKLDAWTISLDSRAGGSGLMVQGSRALALDPDRVVQNKKVLDSAFARFDPRKMVYMPGTMLLCDNADVIGKMEFKVCDEPEVYMNPSALGLDTASESWWCNANGTWCPILYTCSGFRDQGSHLHTRISYAQRYWFCMAWVLGSTCKCTPGSCASRWPRDHPPGPWSSSRWA